MSGPAIRVVDLAKRYRVGRGVVQLRTLFRDIRERDGDVRWAVRDVSFEVGRGEAMAIIGPNGAGKTSILKMLSRVTTPTSGRAEVAGRVSALIELGAGFHPDLTGRENIFLNGVILGMRRREIRRRFDEIVEFAGIGPYLDTPIKRYSSGMYARLGFSVAAHVEPEILLVDEVLAVGDMAFQQKCQEKMRALRARGTSLVLVSHNLDVVRRTCDRALVLLEGRTLFQGSAADAVVAYSDAIRDASRSSIVAVPEEKGLARRAMTFDCEIESVRLLDQEGESCRVFRSGSIARVCMEVRFHRDVVAPVFALSIFDGRGQVAYDVSTHLLEMTTPSFGAGEAAEIVFTIETHLVEGSYEITVDVASSDLTHYFDRRERAIGLIVESAYRATGVADLHAEVEVARRP
jgi:lipopolysaccharide transport system ATP-binding protein